jgi:hypothetical protein
VRAHAAGWLRLWPVQLGLLLALVAALMPIDLFGRSGHGDVDLYHRYALAFWAGSPPFHLLPVEYPPLAILPFTLTVLPPLGSYVLVFGLWMGATLVGGFFLFDRLFSRRAAVLYVVYLTVGALGTLIARFDLVPSLVTVLALAACQRRRFWAAYVLLGLGVLLKLYPIVLLPILMLEHRRVLRSDGDRSTLPGQVILGAGAAATVMAIGFGFALGLEGEAAFSAFRYALHRPVQVESVAASLLWLLSGLGVPMATDHSFGSFNVVSGLSGPLTSLSSLTLAAGSLWIYWRQVRGRISVGRAMIAAVCLFLATSKVLSPQFMIWVLPLLAAEEDLHWSWILVGAATTLVYPFAYQYGGLRGPLPAAYAFPFMAAIALRNGLLLVATLRALRPGLPDGASMTSPQRPAGSVARGSGPAGVRDPEPS